MLISSAQEAKKRQITANQIDAVFAEWDTKDKPGMAVGILNDGKIVHAKGYGLANLEYGISVSPDTKFHIGGIAKEFTVYALLLLEQRGHISLKDDIKKYIPQLKSLANSITIQQLLHHTSGLNNHEVSKALSGWNTEDIFTKEQAYTMILNQSKSLPNKNSIQRHTDYGFMILEDLISTISNMSYSDFVTKEIFEPLGMTNSVFDTQGNIIVNKAQGYIAHNNSFVNSSMNYNHTILSDVYTTVRDMCLWAKELGNPIIGTKQMVEKFDSLSVINNEVVEETNMALYTGGHRFWNFRGAKKLYHRTLSRGYSSKLIRYPDYNLAIVIMENDGVYNGHLATRASAMYIEDFLDKRSEGEESTKIKSKKLSKENLTAFIGDYWDKDNHSSRKIHIVNDTLRYYRAPGNESALIPLTKNSFKMMTWGDVLVHFNSDSISKTMDVVVGNDNFHLVSYDLDAQWSKNLEVFTGNYYAADLNTSYSLSIDKGNLILKHPRLETVQLSPRITDVFSGDQRHFSSLTFKRNANGKVKGFILSTGGVTDIWFGKQVIRNDSLVKTK